MTTQHHSVKYLLVGLLVALLTLGACSNDVNEELRPSISAFITDYFPFESVSSYTENADGTYTVVISNGAQLTFDSEMQWTSINGRGSTLPEVLVEDLCPAPLLKYIEEMEFTDQVYLLSRTSTTYHVEFLDTYIDYTIADGKITYPTAKS